MHNCAILGRKFFVQNLLSYLWNLATKKRSGSRTKSNSRLKKPSRKVIKLVNITIPSIYKVKGKRVDLPPPLNKLVEGAANTLYWMEQDVLGAGGNLYLSDAFRTYDMQLQAHLDYTNGKKKSYSPPPGNSFHEAGRAIDIDVGNLGITLAKFWEIAKNHGWNPIIERPSSGIRECWHFDFYEYCSIIKNRYGYKTAAKFAIVDIGIKDDEIPNLILLIQGHLFIQSYYSGELDSICGSQTQKAISQFKKDNNLSINTGFGQEFIKWLKLKTYDKWEMLIKS